MSKINRTVAFLLSAAFMFNSVNYDVVVKAITENVQEYMEEKKAEEQQKEDDETKEVTTSAVTTSVLTTEVTETTETSETSEEITTVVTDIPKESDTTVTTAVSDTTPAVTSENKTINSTEIYSDDTSDVDFKTELNGDQEIDSIDENTRINGNATIKSGSDINIKQKTVVEIKGNLTIEPDAHLNVSESEIRIIVRGNLIINGQLKCSNSPVLLEGDLIDNEENINEGNGTIVLIGEKRQIIDTNRQIYRLVNRNKSDKPLVFINSLNFENYIDNGNGIISYEKDENGNYTTNPVPVKISNKITLFGSETGLSELIVHNGLCIENGDVGITNDNQKNVTLRIKGDYTQTGGTLKTFGQRMIVEGNYIQSGGTYELIDQHAKLSVLGNMTLKDNSVFKMNQADTRVIVNGDFTVSSNGVNDFKNGVLEIKGDFTQQGNADNLRFSDSGHKVILNGDGRQSVFFGTPTRINPDKSVISRGAQFDTLEITKPFYEYDFKNDLSRERVYENLIQPYDEFYKNTDNKPYRIRRSLNAPVSHLELVDAGGDIYAIGGADVNKKILSDVSRYNFGSNTWQTAGYLNTKRADFAAAAVEDNIYVFGGYDGSRVLNSIELITSKGIENVNLIGDNSLIARKSHEAVYYNGKIYIIGGESADGEILNTVEIFDPVSKTVVVSENSMKTARKNFGASLYFDGNKVYLVAAGGENSSGILKSVEFYDFEKEEWIDKDDLNTPRKGFGLAFIMGKLYAVGGVTADNESGAVYTDTTEGYDGTGWVYLNDGEKNISTSVPRGYFGSAVAYNSLFIAGGETPDVTDVFEQFMPENVRGARFKGNSKGLNGDFTQEKTDLVFNSPVQKLSLDRVYNSQFKDEKSEFLGCGWKFNFESSVKKLSNNKGTVTATYLNVRDNPWGNIIGGLEKGTVFEIDIEGSKKDYNGKTWYKLSGGNWYVSSGYVELVTTDAVEITYPDGIKGYFTKNEEGKYKGNFGTYDSFTFEDSKTCKLTTKDQISYIYTLDGEIFRNTAIKDRYGNQISIKHSSGKVEITDSSGEKITVTKVENKVTATDGRGRTVTYELEGDDLKSVTDTSGLETIYKYNNHSITKITENGNPFCEVEYDKSDRIHKYTDADGNISYNYYEDVYMDENNEVQGIAGNLRRMVVDPSGNETITQYSLSEKRPVSVLDAVNGITSYKYEIKYNGDYVNVTGMKDSDEWYKKTYIKTILKGQYPTSETVKDSNGQETVIEKDERGNVINKTNPDGSYTKYTYDTNCNNVLSEMLYDAGGNVISSIKYSYYNNGALKTVENGSSGSTETYTYDDTLNVKGLIASKVTSRSSSAKITTTYSYDEKGQLISETTGNRTTYYAHSYGPFDKDQKVTLNGKDVIIEKPANDYEKCIFYVQTKLNPEGIFEVSYFDKTLNLVKSTISSGPDAKSTSLYVYDAHGRKIKEVSPEVYANKASEADKLTESCHTYKYSISGLLSEETDEEGDTTRYEYDKNGNLAKQTEPSGAVYEFLYDGLNRIKEKKCNDLILEEYTYENGGGSSSPYKSSKLIHTEYINGDSGLVTETELDYAGRETVSDNPFRKTEKEYYADGNLKRERVFDKSAESKCISDILYFYNDRGMLETTLTGYKPDKSYFISKNIYTLDGLLEYEIVYLDAQEINPDSPKWSENAKANVIRYEYDEHGNVLTESTYTGEISIADVSSAAYVVRTSREYDFPDNTVTEQSGNIKTVYVNNYLGKPVTVKNVVKSSDLIASAAGTGDETELETKNTYDRNGNLTETITPSGTRTEYSYDNLGRLTETKQHDVPSDDGSKTGILTETLSYNWAGNVTKKVLKFDDSVKSELKYCYDSRNNLILSADKVGDKYAVNAYEYNRAGLLTAEASPESFAGISSEEPLSAETYSIAAASGHTKYTYDEAGRLKTKEFVGSTYTLDEEKGSMTAAADSFVISAFEYDANDNLIKEIDGEEYGSDNAKGKTYTYSGTGNVLTERYPESDRDNVIYEYDALGNVKEEKVLKGTSEAVKYAVTNTSYSQVADTDGITEYTQKISSSEGEDVSSVAPLLSTKTWKTDINGNVIEETLGKKKVQTEYNSLGFESKSVTEVDRNDENESVNSEIKTLYDNEGNAAVIIRSSGIVEINKYDNLRRLISKTTGKRPEGVADNQLSADKLTDSVTLKWTYDVQGNVRYEYDGNGFKTEYQYDELSRLVNTIKRYGTDNVSEDRMTYNLDGNLTEETTVLNDIQTGKKTYIYDDLGRVIQKSDFDVPYEFIEYNKNSDQVKSFDAGYVLKEFGYNADRQLTKTILAGVCTEELTYDYAGNVYIKKDGEGNSSFYYYDVMDRLVKVSSAGKNDETPAEIASYTYNTEGNIASKTAGSKNKVTYEYTASDEVKETNSNGKTEKFFYNTDGRLSKSVDPAGNETVYTYNAQGLTVKEEVKADGKVVISKSYTYDKNGNVLKSSVTENGKENVITRTYDELGRVTKKEATDSVTSEFIYDLFTEDNLLCEVTRYDNGESSSNVYDKFGRLKYVYSTDISAGADDTKKTEYTYDNKGRRTSIVYPNGAKSTYEYYDDNNVKVLTNFILNKDAKSDDDKYKEIEKYEYTYYTNNTMSGKTETFDGVEHGKTEYKYDNLLRLVSTKETRNEENYRDITYSYDDSGNRIKEESIEKGVTTTKAYTYGEGNLLLGYTVTTGTEKTDEVKYEYDKNGNLVKEFDIIKNGKVCSDKEKLKTQNTYNALNQLVSSETSEFTVTNEYNAEGLRTGKEVKSEGIDTSTKNYYTYEYDKVIFETDSSENYIWNVQGINLISRQINGEMFCCMYNAHADITRMVDSNGELAEKYYYDEWGVETETLKYGDVNCDGEVDLSDYSSLKSFILQETEKLTKEQQIVSDVNGDGIVNMTDANLLKFSVLHPESVNFPADTNKDGFINEKNNIKYAGYFYDAETELYYLNARFYDPETARFIQQDSYSGNILDPLSLNLYTYAQNNPISYYDPTGHSIKSLLKKAKDTVKKAASTIKAVATIAKPVVKQAVKSTASIAKTVTTTAINSGVRSDIQPVREAVKYVTNATENIRGQYETGLALMKTSMFSSGANAIANYYQGTYDTIMGQVEGFNQFYDNPVQTVSSSVNYFLSDPLKNNPVYGAGKWCSEFKSAVASNDWNTASYKLGVGVVNTAEVAGSIAIGGKIGGKIPTGKVSVPKVGAIGKIRNAIDNFGTPALAGANGMVISGAVPIEASISSATVASASGVVAGAAVGQNVFYSSKCSGQSSGKDFYKTSVNNKEYNPDFYVTPDSKTLKSKDYKSLNNALPKSRLDVHNDLINKGFSCNGTSEGGYVTYVKGDSRVDIRPNGEVICTQRVKVNPNDTAWNAKKYSKRYYYDGTPVPNEGHNTYQYVESIDNASIVPLKPNK